MVDPVPELGNSRDSAINKFLSLERKLEKNPDLKCQYHNFIREYETLNHMTKIDESDIFPNNDNLIYYLPHHGVVREDSLTTKLRVVFNGSFITNSGVSLNDILLVGPQLQDDLFSIITRFRKHEIVIIADVEKMYRMVDVTESHRDMQRIIWRYDTTQPLNHFRLNTLTYGTAPASFLAIRCLHECALENIKEFPEAANTILSDFYVDDLITGSNSIDNAIKMKQEISKILSSCGFILRKWASNESSIFRQKSDLENNSQYFITDSTSHKTLGLQWHSHTDTFNFIINSHTVDDKITKRSILSTISQIFDPMGLIGPITIKAKIILQRLWQLKLDWNDSVPSSLETEFTHFKTQLSLLSKISIPRHVILSNSIFIEMHGFSDASQHAYGTCIYIVSHDSLGNFSANLLCAKSRVAPLKVLSLPRLELCRALLLAQLAEKAEKSLKINLQDKLYWCDSSIVLSWLQSEPINWQVFVANRVSEIQRLTNINRWHHISSKNNPADVISRGMDPENLSECKLWWSGPSFLTKEKHLWPQTNINFYLNDVPEKRKNTFSLIAPILDNSDYELFTRYSSLLKLQRIVAYCIRFISNCSPKINKRTNNLTLHELDKALIVIIKNIQSHHFNTEINLLSSGKSISPTSKLASLNPFLDKDKIIRVGGRISRAMVSYDFKFPIVLPSKNHVTDLIIQHEHKINLHAGAQATLAAIRHKFWPLKGKSVVKKVLRQCMTCFRAKPY